MMGKSKQKLIDALAGQLIQEEAITPDTICAIMYGNDGPLWRKVQAKVSKLTAAELGTVSACGQASQNTGVNRTTLYQVHSGTWLGKYDSGISLLREIAATALAARIKDRLLPQ